MAAAKATNIEPNVKLKREDEDADRNCEGEAVAVGLVPLLLPKAAVVRVGAAAAGGVYEAVTAPAATVAGACVPTTRAAEVEPAAVAVAKATCGTVMAVEMTD